MNRLKTGIFKQNGSINNFYDETLTYDKNGNIMSVFRNGNATSVQQIDNLVYSYGPANNINQLTKVVDNATTYKAGGFVDSAVNTVDDYSYDANGNMTKDNNKNITAIVYNHLNLPTKITFATTGNIVYIYNAAGQKVQKIVNETSKAAITTDYLGGYQYDNALLKFFPTAEGYVEPSGSSYKYVYQYKDHLGNVRLGYDKTLAIKEESNFYPFGLKQEGYNNVKSGVENKYKFQGQELQDELGLNFYDYGARNYDPALGRWMNIDPLAEKMRRWSPYNYCFDNPMHFVDPDGMGPLDWFVNNITGAVVHVEGQSKLTQATADKIGAGDAKNYDRLGADNMFGNDERANNIRDLGASVVENPKGFMENRGYEKAEKVTVKEREFTSGGAMGEEKITSTITDMKQIGDAKVTYAKPEQMNEKKVLGETSGQSSFSSSRSTTYSLTKPAGQENAKTAEYYGNKHTDYATGIKMVDNLIQVAKGLIQSIKK